MKIDACLKNAVTSIDLSTWEMRCGAIALVIVLLEKIWIEESNVPGNLERYAIRSESFNPGISEYEENLLEISYSISMLYRTFGLINFQRMSISKYLRKIDADALDTAHTL